ncbi:hypothetical protein KC365_g14897 [Hortaea werneckii]|nr:hypothetical protein KC342_g16610 [Hortaea werneckii]KAI7060337.1 hypothetical protein KC339_g17154 [Hortaea werneckii]KAI7211641.1 hypothetical protein KC365_g14897 [Hortaea werneckii]
MPNPLPTASSTTQSSTGPNVTSTTASNGQNVTSPTSPSVQPSSTLPSTSPASSAAADDYERLHELKRLLGPPAFEVVKLIKCSHKPAYHLSIELFSTSGVRYIAVVERFGIAAFVQLLGLVPGTISDLAILSKLDRGVFTAFESAKHVDCPGFDFHEPPAFWGSKFDYWGASAFIYLGIFCGHLLELPELLGPSTYEIV